MTDPLLAALRRGPTPAKQVSLALGNAAVRAADTGAADVAYAEIDSALGLLVVAATHRGLVTVAFARSGTDPVLEHLAARLSPRIVRAPSRLDIARREIDEYLAGRRRRFDLPLDWSLAGPFQRRVLRRTAEIPYGATSTYGEIASRAGSPRGARAAGNALGANPLPIVIPCHRVLPRGGTLGGYTGGTHLKEALLTLEAAGA
jgi:methylated-DNA-[protein]-cysteine S-methyltransferase